MITTNSVEILIVEDTPGDLELALRALKKPISPIAFRLPATVRKPWNSFSAKACTAAARWKMVPK
jgi:hypothetical protein